MFNLGRSFFSRDRDGGSGGAGGSPDSAPSTSRSSLAGDGNDEGGGGGGGGGGDGVEPFEKLLVPIEDLDLADTAECSSNDFAQLASLLPEADDKSFGPKGLNLGDVLAEIVSVLESCDEIIENSEMLDYRWIVDLVQFARDFVIDPMAICARYRYLDLMGKLGEWQADSQLKWDLLSQALASAKPTSDAAVMVKTQDRLMLMFNSILEVNKRKRRLAAEISAGCLRTCSALARGPRAGKGGGSISSSGAVAASSSSSSSPTAEASRSAGSKGGAAGASAKEGKRSSGSGSSDQGKSSSAGDKKAGGGRNTTLQGHIETYRSSGKDYMASLRQRIAQSRKVLETDAQTIDGVARDYADPTTMMLIDDRLEHSDAEALALLIAGKRHEEDQRYANEVEKLAIQREAVQLREVRRKR